jgi:hypothetical protein
MCEREEVRSHWSLFLIQGLIMLALGVLRASLT